MKQQGLKLRKGVIEKRVKASIERAGGTFIKINWSKGTVHFLAPNKVKKSEYLNLSFRNA